MRRVLVTLAACVLMAACQPNPESQAKTAAKDAVLAQLKAPATARFTISSVTCKTPPSSCWVTGAVDAENSYGALIRTKFLSQVDRDADGRFADAGTFLTD